MATIKRTRKTVSMTASVHGRVDASTPTPYLARVMNSAGKPTPIVVIVTAVHSAPAKLKMPPWGVAYIMSSAKGSYYKRGEQFRVDNFRCLRRLKLTSISDA
jgi:hypothetical protein